MPSGPGNISGKMVRMLARHMVKPFVHYKAKGNRAAGSVGSLSHRERGGVRG
jgi:hypothetical protein